MVISVRKARWSRLGDTGLLQPFLGDVGLGFCQAVDDYLSEEG